MDDIQLTPELSVELYLISQGGAFPRPITGDATQDALSYLRQIRSGIVSFMSSDEQAKYEPPPQKPHDSILDKLAEDQAPELLQELSAQIEDPEMHADYLSRLMAVREYAFRAWPSVTIESGFGTDATEPDPATMMQANATLAVLNDPRRLISSLRSWTVEPSEVTAVQAVYPELYNFIKETLLAEIDKRRARRSYHLAWEKESNVKTILGIPPGAKAEARSGSQPSQAPRPSSAPRKESKPFSQEATVSQRIESK